MKGFYWKRTLWSFGGAVLLAFTLFILIAAGIHYGFTDLLGLTTMARESLLCCKTVFSWCLVSPSMFMTIIPWVGFGFVTTGLVIAFFRAGRSLLASRRFLKNIHPVSPDNFPVFKGLAGDDKTEVISFEDNVLNAAFTIGLLKPRVYVSTVLIKELPPEELRAVILHEMHHAKNRDPLRLFIISFVKDTFFFLPLGRYLMDSFYMQKELAADEGAVSATGKPFDMATALLKMVKIKRAPLPAGVPIIDKAGLVEKRVKELLEPNPESNKVPGGATVLTVAGMTVLLIALVLPIYAGTHKMEKCNHDYCLSGKRVCPNDMKDCEKACELMEKE